MNVDATAQYKVLLVGDVAVGKTSIAQRVAYGTFSDHHKSTVGVDCLVKQLNCTDAATGKVTKVVLQFWDIAGQELAGTMSRTYYRDAFGAYIVFDSAKFNRDRVAVTANIEAWLSEIRDKVKISKDGSQLDIPVFLLANKCDIEKVSDLGMKDLQAYITQRNIQGLIETSAKDKTGIDEALAHLTNTMLQTAPPVPEKPEGVVALETTPQNASSCRC